MDLRLRHRILSLSSSISQAVCGSGRWLLLVAAVFNPQMSAASSFSKQAELQADGVLQQGLPDTP